MFEKFLHTNEKENRGITEFILKIIIFWSLER